MKTRIRSALTSLVVSCIALAASGASVPFLGHARHAPAQQHILLAPEGLDGEGLAPPRPLDAARAALSSSSRQ